MIDLIDYKGGNMGSMTRCLKRLGLSFRKTATPDLLLESVNPIIFPGVGAFGSVMESLKETGLDHGIQMALKQGRKFLGVCVGMQALFTKSQESPHIQGLGLIPGEVKRFKKGKVPQVGWNRIYPTKDQWDKGYVYFVNSYVAAPQDPDAVLFHSNYFGPYCAGVRVRNMTGFQFHPEKSGPFGLNLMRRWMDAV